MLENIVPSERPRYFAGPENSEQTLLMLRFDGFLFYDYLHVAGDITVQADGNVELADTLQRLIELDLAAIDVEPFVLERLGDVGGRDRPEQVVLLARLALEGKAYRVQLFGQSFRIGLFDGGAADGSLLHLLDYGFVGSGGFNGQLARQQVVAAVAFRNLDYVAAVTQLGNIFFQNYFHFRSPGWLKSLSASSTQLVSELLDADTRSNRCRGFTAPRRAAGRCCGPV